MSNPSPTERTAEPFADGFTWPQSPRWIDARLYVSDLHAGRVVSYDDDGTEHVVYASDDPDEAFAPCGIVTWDGELAAISMSVNRLVSLRDGRTLAQFDAAYSTLPTDVVRLPSGDLVLSQVGSDIWHGAEFTTSPLIRVRPDGSAAAIGEAGDFMITSGIGLSADGSTLFVTEVGTGTLYALTVAEDGSLSDRRVHARLDVHGACVDLDGGVWIAQTSQSACVRVSPDGASITDVVSLPEGSGTAVACELGGPDLRTLYITTGTESLDAEKSRAGRAGHVVRTEVDVPGVPR